MKILTYQIRLLEPLLATQLGGDPNSSVSYPFIPGSTVRGALITAYGHTKGAKELDAASAQDRAFFFSGQTRYLNAYPLSGGQRSLPTPLSWRREKTASLAPGTAVHDWSHGRTEMAQPKLIGKPFCSLAPNGVLLNSPDRRINIHTTRSNRAYGRARAGEGGVFQYNALAEGQRFAGVILLDDELDMKVLQAWLQDATLLLGGSHNAGYGRVKIESVSLATSDWREVGQIPLEAGSEDLVITLLSDVLLRDEISGLYTNDPAAALALALRISPAELGRPDKAFLRTRPVGGFNRKWGLPLPQAQAIAAGSVWVYQPAKRPTPEALRHLERTGIGERCVEGYGRVAVNWHTRAALTIIDGPEAGLPGAPKLEGASLVLAQMMLDRWQRDALDALLTNRINKLDIHRPPSNAQLARLRVLARDVLGQEKPSLKRLDEFLRSIQGRQSARTQFERARVGRRRLSDWLKQRLDSPASIWDEIGRPPPRHLGINKVEAQPLSQLEVEYTVRLIDGLLAKAARERRAHRESE